MKITNNQVFGAHNYLSGLKLGKFSKEIRVAIFKNVGELSIAVKAVQDKIEASKKELFKDLEEDAQKVGALRDEFNKEETTKARKEAVVKEILTYEKYLEAEKEFNEVVTQFGNDEVEINLSKIDLYDFVDGLVESEIDFTASQLQVISFIFNNIK
jgi:hypothetical protein